MLRTRISARRPTARPEVAVTPLDDGLVLCDARDGRVYVLNQTGRLIWELCDGYHTVDAIVEEIAEGYGLDDRGVRADVDDLLEQLQRAGLVVME